MTPNLLTNRSPLVFDPVLANEIGLKEAIVLQQVHYWLNPKRNKNICEDRHWVWNTYDQWHKQFPFWSVKTIRRVINGLETKGILLSRMTPDLRRLKYYSINYANLQQMITNAPESGPLGQSDQTEMPKCENPYGQIDPIGEDKLLSTTTEEPPDTLENMATAQTVQTEDTKTLRKAQLDHLVQDNLGTLYNDTKTTNSEITSSPPPHENSAEGKNGDELIKIWNEAIQTRVTGKRISLDAKRQLQLHTFVEKFLHGDPQRWRNYCRYITDHQSFMDANLTSQHDLLDWVLKPVRGCEGLVMQNEHARVNQGLVA